jgi:hypothetical protein
MAGAVAFTLASQAARPILLLRYVMWAMGASVTILAGIGLLGSAGIIRVSSWVTTDLRIASVLQYPDAFAAVAIVGLFCILAVAVEQGGWLWLAIAGAVGYAIFASFILAASRGAFLVLPLAACTALWMAPRRMAVDAAALSVAVAIPTILTVRGFAANAALHDGLHALRWLAFGGTMSAIGGLVWSLVSPSLGRIRRDRALLAGFAVLLVVAGLGLGALVLRFAPGGSVAAIKAGPSQLINALLPDYLSKRTADMSLESSAAAQRLIYYGDALGGIATHPLGFGAGAWPSVFGLLQRFYYVGRTVHSHILQVAVDAGFPAFLVYVSFWAAFLVVIWRARSLLQGNDRLVLAATTAGAVALGLHSAIDFTLSYLAPYLFIWVVAGALTSVAGGPARQPLPALSKIIRWEGKALQGMAVVTVILAPFLFISAYYSERGLDLLLGGDLSRAQASYSVAASCEPWSAPAHLGLARAILSRSHAQDGTEAMAREGLNHARLAARYDRALPDGYGILARSLLGLPSRLTPDEAREAVRAAEKAVDQQRYRPEYYSTLGEAYVTLAEVSGDDAERAAVLAKLTTLADIIARRSAEVQPYKRLFSYPQVSMTPDLALRVGQGYLLLGDLGPAEKYLLQASSDRVLMIDAELWLHRLYQLTGDKAQLAKLSSRPWVIFADENPEFQHLRELTVKYESKGGK